jgi:hypothetical protein
MIPDVTEAEAEIDLFSFGGFSEVIGGVQDLDGGRVSHRSGGSVVAAPHVTGQGGQRDKRE